MWVTWARRTPWKFPLLEVSKIEILGNFRSPNYRKVNVFTIREFTNYNATHRNPFEEMSSMDFVIAGFLGGTVYGINWFSDTFYKIHSEKLSQGKRREGTKPIQLVGNPVPGWVSGCLQLPPSSTNLATISLYVLPLRTRVVPFQPRYTSKK